MTNTEYEAASVAAAGCYDRFEGEHKLKQWDEHIATMEAALAKAQEARREIVNQYNLNKPKCEHSYVWHMGFGAWWWRNLKISIPKESLLTRALLIWLRLSSDAEPSLRGLFVIPQLCLQRNSLLYCFISVGRADAINAWGMI